MRQRLTPTWRFDTLYPNLKLPRKVYGNKISSTQLAGIRDAYKLGYDTFSKTVNYVMMSYSEERMLQKTNVLGRKKLNAQQDQITYYLIGLFQNPRIQKKDITTAWAKKGTSKILEELLKVPFLWSEDVLETFIDWVDDFAPLNSDDELSHTEAANALGQYTFWSPQNCHILGKAKEPTVFQSFNQNPHTSDDLKIMVGLLANS